MPTLSERLKSLGVNQGAKDLPAPRPAYPFSIEKVLQGFSVSTPLGETFAVETYLPGGQPHGRAGLQMTASLEVLADWAGEKRIGQFSPEEFAFLDTETTGLSGGTGTYAFLIGAGRFDGGNFHLEQFFMRDPIEEPAQLAALEEFLAPCKGIVTFNGKAFDIPLLQARFITHGWKTPFGELAHIDLLHLARRLWKERLPSRSLPSLEAHILGALRTEEDVPGWMIPGLYFDYLRDGDARPLKSVFYHNSMDVISLAALLNHMAGLLADPLLQGNEYASDLIALGRLYESLGDLEMASRLYLRGLEHNDALELRLPQTALIEAILRLAAINKRQDDLGLAIELWMQAAQYGDLRAHLELAKAYEHRLRDFQEAERWTRSAITLIEGGEEGNAENPRLTLYERRQRLAELNHRLKRLEKKGADP